MSEKLIKTHQTHQTHQTPPNPSNPSNPIKPHQTHHNPSNPHQNQSNSSNPSKPIKSFYSAKPIKPPSNPITTHQTPNKTHPTHQKFLFCETPSFNDHLWMVSGLRWQTPESADRANPVRQSHRPGGNTHVSLSLVSPQPAPHARLLFCNSEYALRKSPSKQSNAWFIGTPPFEASDSLPPPLPIKGEDALATAELPLDAIRGAPRPEKDVSGAFSWRPEDDGTLQKMLVG